MRGVLFVAAMLPGGLAQPASAQSSGAGSSADGAIIVRIDDGEVPRCIDPRNDTVWVTLKRVVVPKSSGWLTDEKSRDGPQL